MDEHDPRTRVVAYLRTNCTDGDALERQREAVTAYARQHGLEITKEYAEVAPAGRGRALRLMLDEVAASGDKTVLTYSLDRLVRLPDHVDRISSLRLITVVEGLDSATDSGYEVCALLLAACANHTSRAVARRNSRG